MDQTQGAGHNQTSSTGTTQWTDYYEPYGAIKTETKNNNKAPTNFMKFTGEYLDPTGLYHLRARQNDPTTGRFLTRDPLAASLAVPACSQYPYTCGRPTVFVDPSGLDSVPYAPPATPSAPPSEEGREAIACGLFAGGFIVDAGSVIAVGVAFFTGGPAAAWETALALDKFATAGAVAIVGGFALSEGVPCLSLVG